MKHANIAIFVPHNGCPHCCSFCNQREITGQSFQPHREDVINALEIARKSLGEKTKQAEIAFFGGSFTAIERDYMLELLNAASPFVKSGEFYGIRISTRPDAIDEEILSILHEHGVTAIELGAQSMDDEVLLGNKRGHTSDDVIKASELIKKSGFSLGLQMMTGLYLSNDEKDIMTAKKLASLSPDTVRIYPTVVLKDTELYDLYIKGKYKPQTVEEAVSLCAVLLSFFEEKGINVIRLGLHDSDSLRENYAAGAFHPALRELCESRMMLSKAMELISENNTENEVVFAVNPSSVSRMTGQKRCNMLEFEKKGIKVKLIPDSDLGKYDVLLKTGKEEKSAT